jgi:hypothetical protein
MDTSVILVRIVFANNPSAVLKSSRISQYEITQQQQQQHTVRAVCAFYYHTLGAHNPNANGNLATCILLFRQFMVPQRQAAKRHWRHLVT